MTGFVIVVTFFSALINSSERIRRCSKSNRFHHEEMKDKTHRVRVKAQMHELNLERRLMFHFLCNGRESKVKLKLDNAF